MKRTLTAAAALVGTVGALLTPAASAQAARATVRTVVRPVTSSGHAAHGYRIVTDHRAAITCTSPSPVAVDAGIAWCGTGADYTLACWKAAKKHRVLCLTDPYTHTLRRIRLDGAFGHWRPLAHPRAQAVTLHSGNQYLIRGGGAWARLHQHPSWVGFYFQRSSGRHAIYGPPSGDGLKQSRSHWTTHVYGDTTKNGSVRLVDRAYYVGTAA